MHRIISISKPFTNGHNKTRKRLKAGPMSEYLRDFTDEQYLALYEDIKSNPALADIPNNIREDYISHFANRTCPECSSPIDPQNYGEINDVEYMVCEMDSCWTLCYTSEKHLDGSSYRINFTSESKLTKLEAAKLAAGILKHSQSRPIESPIKINSDMFSNLEESGEGWFWELYIPQYWKFEYEELNDSEDISELKSLPFEEKVAVLKDRHWGELADYGWTDKQDQILEEMQGITVEGCSFSVTVADFEDAKAKLSVRPIDFYNW